MFDHFPTAVTIICTASVSVLMCAQILNLRQSSHIKCNSQMKIHVIFLRSRRLQDINQCILTQTGRPDFRLRKRTSPAFPTFSIRQFGKLVK